MTSTQELRRAIKEISSPPPQPEDPGRSLDPASQEDPDISMELIDGVFHQSSEDNALVAITADYPGLILTPQVRPSALKTSPAKFGCNQETEHEWADTYSGYWDFDLRYLGRQD